MLNRNINPGNIFTNTKAELSFEVFRGQKDASTHIYLIRIFNHKKQADDYLIKFGKGDIKIITADDITNMWKKDERNNSIKYLDFKEFNKDVSSNLINKQGSHELYKDRFFKQSGYSDLKSINDLSTFFTSNPYSSALSNAANENNNNSNNNININITNDTIKDIIENIIDNFNDGIDNQEKQEKLLKEHNVSQEHIKKLLDFMMRNKRINEILDTIIKLAARFRIEINAEQFLQDDKYRADIIKQLTQSADYKDLFQLLEQLKSGKKKLDDEISSIKEQIQKLKNENETNNNSKNELDEKLKRAQKEKQQFSEKISNATKANSEIDTEIKTLKEKLAELSQRLNSMKEPAAENESNINSLRTQQKELEEQIEQGSKKQEQLNKAIEDMTQKRNKLKRNLELAAENNKAKEGEIAILNSAITKSNASLEQINTAMVSNDTEVERLKTQKAQLDAALRTKEAELTELQQKINDLKGVLEGINSNKDTKEAAAAADKRKLEEEYEQLLKTLDKKTSIKSGLTDEMTRLKEQITGATTSIQELTTQKTNAENDLNAKNSSIEKLKEQLQQLQQKKHEKDAQEAGDITKINEQIAATDVALKGTNEQLNNLKSQLETKNAELEKLKEQLQQLQQKKNEKDIQEVGDITKINEQIVAADAALKGTNEQLDNLKSQLETKNSSIKAAEEQLQQLQQKKNEKDTQEAGDITNINAQITATEAALNTTNTELDSLKSQLEKKNAELGSKRTEIESLNAQLTARLDTYKENSELLNREGTDLAAKINSAKVKLEKEFMMIINQIIKDIVEQYRDGYRLSIPTAQLLAATNLNYKDTESKIAMTQSMSGQGERSVGGFKEKFEQDNFKLLIYLKNFENLLYKENNDIMINALNYVDFFNAFDKLKKDIETFIKQNYQEKIANKLINKLFTNKINALMIENFKNIFYNIMFNNCKKNIKLFKILKNELKIITTHNLDNLIHYIFYSFNNNFKFLFKNKRDINYLEYIDNINATNCVDLDCILTLKENIFGCLDNNIEQNEYNSIFNTNNKYNNLYIYFLIIINIFIFYMLFKIINNVANYINLSNDYHIH
jgi:chromosome segregation ATPase